jgi:hypothetical protein
MTKGVGTSFGAGVTPDTPWYKRSILGEGGIISELLGKFFSVGGKLEIPDNVQAIHDGEMMALRIFAKTMEAIDSYKFGDQEFILYVKIKYCLARGIDEYEGLDQSIKFLQAAIEAKDSYLTLDQTELRYRSHKQQEFYEYIESLLGDHEDRAAFNAKVHEKLIEVLPEIKTEEGKTALQEYTKELARLSKFELGLKLFSLFKAYQLADYTILTTISNMVINIREREAIDYKALVALVISKYDVFDKLKKIIGISDKKHTPDTYARMLQVIALSYRHQNSYPVFAELLQVIRKWYLPYRAIVGIREEYPATGYKQPLSFTEPLLGIAIYEKYKSALTDKKTGVAYVDFGGEA